MHHLDHAPYGRCGASVSGSADAWGEGRVYIAQAGVPRAYPWWWPRPSGRKSRPRTNYRVGPLDTRFGGPSPPTPCGGPHSGDDLGHRRGCQHRGAVDRSGPVRRCRRGRGVRTGATDRLGRAAWARRAGPPHPPAAQRGAGPARRVVPRHRGGTRAAGCRPDRRDPRLGLSGRGLPGAGSSGAAHFSA